MHFSIKIEKYIGEETDQLEVIISEFQYIHAEIIAQGCHHKNNV